MRMNEVKLDDVIEALEFASDEGNYYYNKNTNRIIYIGEEEARIAEDCDEDDISDYPEWQREDIENSIDLEENWEDFISLPGKFDINEYGIMEKFCYIINNKKIADQLLSALQGKGAFRRFKDTAIRLNVEDKWYTFRDEAIKKIALDWCSENDIKPTY